MLQISCARHFLAITIYSILPNYSTPSDIANSAVKMGLPEKLVFNTDKVCFALSLRKFCPSQKLAKHQTFLKAHHYMKDRMKDEQQHMLAAGFSETTGKGSWNE